MRLFYILILFLITTETKAFGSYESKKGITEDQKVEKIEFGAENNTAKGKAVKPIIKGKKATKPNKKQVKKVKIKGKKATKPKKKEKNN
tara:strand:- start:1000 stop:1266 length:267 start_codon:yes stop_codon:yes gene_type:complete